MRHAADRYAGGTRCGNGYSQTMEGCPESAMDGFRDYVGARGPTTSEIHSGGQEFRHAVEAEGMPDGEVRAAVESARRQTATGPPKTAALSIVPAIPPPRVV